MLEMAMLPYRKDSMSHQHLPLQHSIYPARYHKNEDGSDDAQLEHMLYRIVKSSCNDQQATLGALRQTYDAHETEDTNRGCQLYLAVSGHVPLHLRLVIHKHTHQG